MKRREERYYKLNEKHNKNPKHFNKTIFFFYLDI